MGLIAGFLVRFMSAQETRCYEPDTYPLSEHVSGP